MKWSFSSNYRKLISMATFSLVLESIMYYVCCCSFFFILSAFAEQLTVLHGCYGSCNPWGSQILDFLFYSAEQKRGVCHSSGRFGLLVFDGHIDNLLQVLLWSFFCPVCGQTDLSTTLCVMDDI